MVWYSNIEVVGALTLAGLVNAAMLMMAAGAFHAGHRDVAEIATAYHTLAPLLGGAARSSFWCRSWRAHFQLGGGHHGGAGDHAGVLAARGAGVGRGAGDDAAGVRVVAAGADVTRCLVLSQVVLSLVLPVPMLALLVLSRGGR